MLLPRDILQHIAIYLPPPEVYSLRLLCKKTYTYHIHHSSFEFVLKNVANFVGSCERESWLSAPKWSWEGLGAMYIIAFLSFKRIGWMLLLKPSAEKSTHIRAYNSPFKGMNIPCLRHRDMLLNSLHWVLQTDLLRQGIFSKCIPMHIIAFVTVLDSVWVLSRLLNFLEPIMEANDQKAPFITACKEGRLEVVAELLQHPDVVEDVAGAEDFKKLIDMCSGGYPDLANMLLVPRPVKTNFISTCYRKAMLLGNVEMLRYLVRLQGLRVSFRLHPADFITACQLGRTAIVEEALKNDQRFNPSTRNQLAIRTVCRHGFADLVKLLLSYASVDPSVENYECLKYALQESRKDIIELLLVHPSVDLKEFHEVVDSELFNSWIGKAIAGGMEDLVNWFFQSTKFRYTFHLKHKDFVKACVRGSTSIIHNALCKDPEFLNPINIQCAIKIACAKGHVTLTEYLLSLPGAFVDSTCFRGAVENGHSRIVSILLHHPHLEILDIELSINHSIDLAYLRKRLPLNAFEPEFSSFVHRAMELGCVGIVRCLLQLNGTFGNFPLDSLAFYQACELGRADIVSAVLNADKSFDPSIFENRAIRRACIAGHVELARVLLNHPKMEPKLFVQACLLDACSKGHVEMVAMLLRHPDVDVRDEEVYLTIKQRGSVALLQVFQNRSSGHVSMKLLKKFRQIVIGLGFYVWKAVITLVLCDLKG
ncbi:hypothetical protein BC829DRAFT_490081 [Chytridium lagenaria]|nr:hypothetical protein BC829DRAFT_490081 [Chytridium lagenaria]